MQWTKIICANDNHSYKKNLKYMWLFQHSPSFILFKSPWQYVRPLDRGRGQTLFSEGAVIWFHWHLENIRNTTKLGWELFWQLLQTYKFSAWYWWHRTDFPVCVVETSKPTQSCRCKQDKNMSSASISTWTHSPHFHLDLLLILTTASITFRVCLPFF